MPIFLLNAFRRIELLFVANTHIQMKKKKNIVTEYHAHACEREEKEQTQMNANAARHRNNNHWIGDISIASGWNIVMLYNCVKWYAMLLFLRLIETPTCTQCGHNLRTLQLNQLFNLMYYCRAGTDPDQASHALIFHFPTKKLNLHELAWFGMHFFKIQWQKSLAHFELCRKVSLSMLQFFFKRYINISINEIERKTDVDGHRSALIELLTSFCFNKFISISIFFWIDVSFLPLPHATNTSHGLIMHVRSLKTYQILIN